MKKRLKLILALLTVFMLCTFAACGGEKPVENITFEYNWEYVLSHLPSEYSISYTVNFSSGDGSYSMRFKVIHTAQGYYFEDNDGIESSTLYIKNGQDYERYYYDNYEEIFVSEGLSFLTSQENINTVIYLHCGMYMTPWSDTSGMARAGSQTIAGRSCDKYTYSVSGFGQSITYTYFVDKEIGACLKMLYTASIIGESGGFEFECTEFKTKNITLPSYK